MALLLLQYSGLSKETKFYAGMLCNNKRFLEFQKFMHVNQFVSPVTQQLASQDSCSTTSSIYIVPRRYKFTFALESSGHLNSFTTCRSLDQKAKSLSALEMDDTAPSVCPDFYSEFR